MNKFFDLIEDHPGKMLIALVVLLLSTAAAISAATCNAKWSGSGHETRWGPIQGCQVQRADGRWIPSSALRDIDL